MFSTGASATNEFGTFSGSFKVEALANEQGYKVLEPLHFRDSKGLIWTIPNGAMTKGASIPRTFWSIVGTPFSGKFRRAAAIHDYYCQTKVRSWQDTHRVFYEMLKAEGVSDIKAQTMYAAVYQFGPRWTADSKPKQTDKIDEKAAKNFSEQLKTFLPEDTAKLTRSVLEQKYKDLLSKHRLMKAELEKYKSIAAEISKKLKSNENDKSKDLNRVVTVSDYAKRAQAIFRTPAGDFEPVYSNSYALLIGISKYEKDTFWKQLPGTRSDVDALADALKDYHGFEVKKLFNPTSQEFKDTIEELITTKGVDPDARILVFYAGHGFTLGEGGLRTGWLIPTDTPDPNKDRRGFINKAVEMQQVHLWSRIVRSKHVLWIFDSCFSGGIIERLRGPSANFWEQHLKTGGVRRIITSGSANQKVPDKSVFAENLINVLRGEIRIGDKDEMMTGLELSSFLKAETIRSRGRFQTPQFGTLPIFGSKEGDFLMLYVNSPVQSELARN